MSLTIYILKCKCKYITNFFPHFSFRSISYTYSMIHIKRSNKLVTRLPLLRNEVQTND